MPDTPPAVPVVETTPSEPTTPPDTDALKSALDKERQARKDAEKAAKAQASELDRLKAELMSDQEKAIKVARDEAVRETTTRMASRLVASEVRAALAGRSVDADALLEGLDAGRFLGDDGDVDTNAVKAWVDRIAPAAAPADPLAPQVVDIGQGNRGTTPAYGIGDDDPLLRDLKSKLGIG